MRVVVLHGEGRAFCAGLDMGRFREMGSGQSSGTLGDIVERTHGLANGPQQVAWGWRELPVPVIAAVHGVAFGGGLQIALGADIRCVHPDTQLAVMEIKWGLVPDMAGCVLLSELARPDVVRELTFSGRTVTGTEALTLGLATRVSAQPAGRRARARCADREPQPRRDSCRQAAAQRGIACECRAGVDGRVARAAASHRQPQPARGRAGRAGQARAQVRRLTAGRATKRGSFHMSIVVHYCAA